LDETDLTLSDLKEVSEAFFHVLSNIFHRRVDYPGFDFEERRGAESAAAATPAAEARAQSGETRSSPAEP
ncbi:MAG: hypothetical protein R3244_10815, partial [Thermoanaerobaculia bacterium]|nr:hypothetical protein [Thermoanaerobaculia bacterium]